MKPKERLLLLVLALVQFTNIIDFMIMMPLGPRLMATFHIAPPQFAAVVSAYTISAGLSGFLSAFFMDRFDRKQVLTLVFIGFTLGTAACGLAPTFSFLMAARVLTGIFGGLLGGLVLSIVSDTFPVERRGAAMGIVMSAFSVASVVGVPTGLFLANHYNVWHLPFLWLAGVAAVVCVLVAVLVPNLNAHLNGPARHSPFDALTLIFKNKEQQKALLLMALMMFGQFTIVPFLATFYTFNLKFSDRDLELMYICGGVASFFTGPAVGFLSDKLGKRKLFIIFSLAMMVPLLVITNLTDVPVWVAILISCVFFITVGGRSIPAMSMITGTVQAQQRGSFMAINTTVQHAGSGIASLLGGMIITRAPGLTSPVEHFPIAGYIAAGTALVALYVGSTLRFQEQSTPAPAVANSPNQVAPPQLEPSAEH